MYAGAAELPLIGGQPALDLINTVEPREPVPDAEPHDHLLGSSDLLRWAVRAGLVADEEATLVAEAWARDRGSADTALAGTKQIREAVYAALLAVMAFAAPDAPTTRSALEQLHLRWTAAMVRSTLILAGDGTPARLAVGTAPALLVPDRAAHAAVELLRTADPARVRACPIGGGGCGWVFLDRSRNGSRRWCQMADCGTQVKARRLTARRRAARISRDSQD
jgi:predicted RNA-binding Zn ribbon-like protein